MQTNVDPNCCPVMTLVLARANDKDRTGMFREPSWPFHGGPVKEVTVIRVRKAPRDDKSAHRFATYAVCNFCPFCGSALTGDRAKRNPKPRKKAP